LKKGEDGNFPPKLKVKALSSEVASGLREENASGQMKRMLSRHSQTRPRSWQQA
jgi:hypothetical protein